MVTEKIGLKKLVSGIKAFKKKAGVEKALLFGSYATGKAGPHSDVDLILLSPRFKAKTNGERLKGLWLKWNLGLPVDFICYTPEEFEHLRKGVNIVSDALKHGMKI